MREGEIVKKFLPLTLLLSVTSISGCVPYDDYDRRGERRYESRVLESDRQREIDRIRKRERNREIEHARDVERVQQMARDRDREGRAW